MGMNLPEGFIVVGPDATREECIAAWVKNLRNPRVRHAKERLLEHDGSMCCLGVACATLAMEPCAAADGTPSFGYGTGQLPDEAMLRLGIADDEGRFGIANSLTTANDSGSTFSEIADLIESRPPGLFVE